MTTDAVRISEELYDIIVSEHTLHSISIIPFLKSSLVLEHGNLAISATIYKSLSLHTYQEFQTVRKSPESPEKDQLVLKLTNVLVLLNPDDARFWNHRKRFLRDQTIITTSVTPSSQQSHQVVISRELELARRVLLVKPKCPEAFNHCRWVLHHQYHKRRCDDISQDVSNDVITKETICHQLDMCSSSASSYKHNYYSWTYRLWLVTWFPSLVSLDQELSWSRKWIESHVSQYCGINYRFNLVRLSSQGQHGQVEVTGEIWYNELSWLCELILFHPDVQAFWCYLRVLLAYFCSCDISFDDKNLDNVLKVDNQFSKRFKKLLKCTS